MQKKLYGVVWMTYCVSVMAQAEIALEPVAGGFNLPLYVTHAGDGSGRLFIVEQRGRIRIVNFNGEVLSQDFLNLGTSGLNKVSTSGNERGLLGLAFHPDYAANGRLFVNYTRLSDGATIIEEYRLSSNPHVAETQGTVVLGPIVQPQSNHNGGCLTFGPDGMLYIATGDGGGAGDSSTGHTASTGNSQDVTSNLLGKILRIDVDRTESGKNYAIPADNPFVGIEGDDEIFAYGLRNPWRFSFDRITGELFCGDVGQNAWEEIDIIERGGNYGWRVMEGTHCYNPSTNCDPSGKMLPIHEYTRSQGQSVTGGYVYRGTRNRALVGRYLFGDFGSGKIWALDKNDNGIWKSTELIDTNLGISSFGEDESGELYVCDLFGGGIYRIRSLSGIELWQTY